MVNRQLENFQGFQMFKSYNLKVVSFKVENDGQPGSQAKADKIPICIKCKYYATGNFSIFHCYKSFFSSFFLTVCKDRKRY